MMLNLKIEILKVFSLELQFSSEKKIKENNAKESIDTNCVKGNVKKNAVVHE